MTNHDSPMSARDRYIERLPDMPAVDLLDDLESCARQNRFGSHDDQASLVRAEILRRMAQGEDESAENDNEEEY